MFDWLTGKKRQADAKGLAPKEKIVSVAESSPDSLFLVIERPDGIVDVMDRDSFDYHYGASSLPDPIQQDLDQLLRDSTRARAVSGGMFRGQALESAVLVDTSNPDAMAALRACLQINADPTTFEHCMCLGGPTLELFAGSERAATLGLQHGRAIRWGRWKHDAQLRDGGQLSAWLVNNGLDAQLLETLYENPFGFTGGRVIGWGPRTLSAAEQRLFLAEIWGQQGNLPAALKECDAVLAGEPGLARGHALRGFLLEKEGEVEASITALSRAIELGHDRAEVLYARAMALDQLGRRDAALADCTSAIRVDPDFCEAYNSRGILRMQLGHLEEAMHDLDTAIRLQPEWELPYLNRAQLALRRCDWGAAISDYTVAIDKIEARKRDSDREMLAKLYRNRGHAYRSLGDSARAEADRREALERDPRLAGR